MECANRVKRVGMRKLVQSGCRWSSVHPETQAEVEERPCWAWVGVRRDVGADSRNRNRAGLGWKVMSSLWYLSIVRGVWKGTTEMSMRQVETEISRSVAPSELQMKIKSYGQRGEC